MGPSGYTLRAACGKDATGTYFSAVQDSLDRAVTVKLLLPGADRRGPVGRAFDEEVGLCSRIDHIALLATLDSGEAGGRPYMVTEPIDLPSLAGELAAGKPLDQRRAISIAVGIADALRYLEKLDLVYRNLCPGYVFLPEPDTPKLLTFRQVRRAAEAEELRRRRTQDPRYCAPSWARSRSRPTSTRWARSSITWWRASRRSRAPPEASAPPTPTGRCLRWAARRSVSASARRGSSPS
ncbi:MAG: protein kinase [Planctomycetota bacterium]